MAQFKINRKYRFIRIAKAIRLVMLTIVIVLLANACHAQKYNKKAVPCPCEKKHRKP